MSPEQFLSVGDLFSEAALLLTREGVVLAANRRVRHVGLTPEEVVGRPLAGLASSPPEQVKDYLRACARSRDPVLGAFVLRGSEGQEAAFRFDGCIADRNPATGETQLLVRLTPKEQSLGQFAALNQKIADLTEEIRRRQQLERDLWDERESLRVTLSSIGDGVIVTDRDARITFINPIAEELTGWSQQEAEGCPLEQVFQIVNEYTRKKAENPAIRSLREGRIVGLANHTILIARDGSERAIDDSAAPIREKDGAVHGVVLVFRDVTETRRLELARSRLAALVRSSGDAIVVKDLDGVVTDWNEAAERLYGYSAAETIGKPLEATILPPDRKHEFADALKQVARGEQVEAFETERRHKSGRRVPISLSLSPIRSGEGEVIGASGIERDITQQKQYERRRNARLAVTQILAFEENVEKAVPRVLEAVCAALDWHVGAFWRVDPESNVLRCREFWRPGSEQVADFENATREAAFQPGESLPGRVWRTGQPHWIADVSNDPGFVRARHAQAVGLHGAFALPVTVGDEFLGVIEFFSHEIQEPDDDLLETMATLGVHLGQFLERRRAEQESQHTRRLLRNVLDHMPAIVYLKDREGRLLLVNRTFADLVGAPIHEIIGRTERDFLPEEDLREIAEHDRVVFETGQTHEFEESLDLGDGVRVYRSIKTPATGIGYPETVLIGISVDVTRRKRTETTLRFLAQASASLAALVDFESTLQKVARLAVPDFADWCGVDLVEPGGSLRKLAIAHVDPQRVKLAEHYASRYPPEPDAQHGVAYVVRTGKSDMMTDIPDELLEQGARDAEQLRLLRELGFKSYMCVPLAVPGRVLGAMSFVSSESGRRYTEEDLRVAEDLARRAATAIENARLYQEVRDADRRKDEFLAMLAHELRNPLAPIRSGLDLLALQGTGDQETVELMKQQVEHLVRLVDDLLDVSRIIRGRVDLRLELVEISTVIRRAVEGARPCFEQQEQELTVSMPASPIWLNADPVRLAQVVGNLLTNACKYTHQGGSIELTVRRQDEEAVISVQDNGIGIEPDLLPKVFDLFTQASRTLDRSQGGLGIGLTLVKSLVELHRGSVSAESAGPGRGSRFAVRLPVAEAPAQVPTQSPQETNRKPRRVLVVDDNVGAAQMLSMLLTTLGPHQVETAHDGPEALARLPEFRPEAVLLDIGLPGMDGYQVCQSIRANPEFASLLLVAVSGYGQEEDRRKSQAAGFDEHLVKPASLESIERVLAHPKLH